MSSSTATTAPSTRVIAIRSSQRLRYLMAAQCCGRARSRDPRRAHAPCPTTSTPSSTSCTRSRSSASCPSAACWPRQLRAEGRREEAARVAALPKPSVVAWAVNQVVRAQPDAAATLWAAGDAVLDAQARVVAGDARGRRAARRDRGRAPALAPLVDAARGLMTGAGRFLGEQNVQPVIETLHAAAIDPARAAAGRRGRLTRPLRLTGLEAALPTTPAPRRTRGARGRPARAEAERRERPTTRDRGRAPPRAERERRARAQEAAQRALARAERARDKARERIAAAVATATPPQRVESRRARLEEAEQALDAAEERLARAHGALEDAEDAVDRARREVEDR